MRCACTRTQMNDEALVDAIVRITLGLIVSIAWLIQ